MKFRIDKAMQLTWAKLIAFWFSGQLIRPSLTLWVFPGKCWMHKFPQCVFFFQSQQRLEPFVAQTLLIFDLQGPTKLTNNCYSQKTHKHQFINMVFVLFVVLIYL